MTITNNSTQCHALAETETETSPNITTRWSVRASHQFNPSACNCNAIQPLSQSHQPCTVASRNAPTALDQVPEQGRLAPEGRVCNPKLMTNGARLHSAILKQILMKPFPNKPPHEAIPNQNRLEAVRLLCYRAIVFLSCYRDPVICYPNKTYPMPSTLHRTD